MILRAFGLAIAQLGDGRFLRTLGLGVALTIALLVAVYAGLLWLILSLAPDSFSVPWFGRVGNLRELLGVGSLVLMLGLSVFLMVPVAALFTGLFTDDVAAAVEARHYPRLPPVPRQRFGDTIVASINFFGVLIAVNALALFLYAFVGPFAPLMFWAVNGWLLGREFFQMAAMRRIGRAGAAQLYRANRGRVTAAGMLMAAPLSLPLVNLLIPVLGAATFTHLVHMTAVAPRT